MTFKTLEELPFSRDNLDFIFERRERLLTCPFDVVNLKRTSYTDKEGYFLETVKGHFKVDKLLVPFTYKEEDFVLPNPDGTNSVNRKCYISLQLDYENDSEKCFPFIFDNMNNLNSIEKISDYIRELAGVVPSSVANHIFVFYNNFLEPSLGSLDSFSIDCHANLVGGENGVYLNCSYHDGLYKGINHSFTDKLDVYYCSYDKSLIIGSESIFEPENITIATFSIIEETYGFSHELTNIFTMKEHYFSFDHFFENYDYLKTLQEMYDM